MPPTPFMGLVLPTVGVTLGPEWATEINAAFSVIDAHNHVAGSGVPIPTAGISLNADLSFNGFNATGLRSVRMANQPSPLALVTDLTCLYVSGNNLYYNNGVGNQVQITQGAGLDASTVGGFGGDYGTSTASAFFTAATETFTFWQDANVPALMDQGPTTLHPTTSATNGITLTPPNTLSTSYQWTLPGTLPSVPAILGISTAGILSNVTADSTTNISGTTISVATDGVTQNELAPRSSPGATAGLGEVAIIGPTTGSAGPVSYGTLATVTITTKGRPVWLGLVSYDSTPGNPLHSQISGTATTWQLAFYRGASAISIQTVTGSGGGTPIYPITAFNTLDITAAGTYSYSVVLNTTGTISWGNLWFVAYEI